MKRIIEVTLLISIFMLVACEKKYLPDITEEGENTFGMLVNGMVWRPYFDGLIFAPSPLSATYYPSSSELVIEANNRKQKDRMHFYLSSIVQPGDYHFDYGPCPDYLDYHCNTMFEKEYNGSGVNDSANIFVLTDKSVSKLHLIKLDVVNKIVSGTFSVKLYNYKGDVLDITSGRFDVKYHE